MWGNFPEAAAVVAAIARCHNPKHPRFKDYGARGIRVCAEWRERPFLFLMYIGERPSDKHSIDRIDNDKGYEPGNLRWATQAEQLRNTRRTRMITHGGKRQCLTDWAVDFGINPVTLHLRLQRGESMEKALSRPSTGRGSGTQRLVAIDGVSKSLAAWGRYLKVNPNTIRSRLYLGWSEREAVLGRI